MTLIRKQKGKRARTIPRPRRVGNMTADELQAMIETLIDRKLVGENSMPLAQHAITPSMRERAVSAAGRFHSGQSDVSLRHDDHLSASYLQ